jgi:hypothetical protein
VIWAAVAGIGAHLFVSGVILTILFVVQSFVYVENGALFFTAFGAAAAVGMAVARALGAGRSAALFALYCLIAVVMDTAQAWLDEQRVRNLGSCCFVVRSTTEVALWQGLTVMGLVLGLAVAPRLPKWSERVRGALEAAGVYALASLPILFLFPVYDPRAAPFLVLQAQQEWHGAVVIGQSALAGVVLASRRSTDVGALAAASAVALIGFLTVAFADLSTWLHVPLHGWTYWPQSLVVVPLTGAVVTLLFVAVAARLNHEAGAPKFE